MIWVKYKFYIDLILDQFKLNYVWNSIIIYSINVLSIVAFDNIILYGHWL